MQLLGAVLAKHFADRQVRVAPEVIAYLVRHMERSLAAAGEIAAALGPSRPKSERSDYDPAGKPGSGHTGGSPRCRRGEMPRSRNRQDDAARLQAPTTGCLFQSSREPPSETCRKPGHASTTCRVRRAPLPIRAVPDCGRPAARCRRPRRAVADGRSACGNQRGKDLLRQGRAAGAGNWARANSRVWRARTALEHNTRSTGPTAPGRC